MIYFVNSFSEKLKIMNYPQSCRKWYIVYLKKKDIAKIRVNHEWLC